jgi:hypothetical protein
LSDAIERARTQNAINSRLSLSLDDYKAVVKRPLRALPLELRPAALAVWTCNKHLKGFETALPIAAIFSVWIDRHGLTVEDAITVLEGMLSPSKMASFEFASQLMNAMAAEVSAVINRRKKEKEQQLFNARERHRESHKASQEQIEKLKEMSAGIGAMPHG